MTFSGPSCGKAPLDVRLRAIRRRVARLLPWRKPPPEPPKVSRAELWSRVHDVLVKEIRVAPSSISPQADFQKDLGLDSMDLIELTMALEEEFGMEIQDEEAQKILTIPQLLELLEERMAHGDRSDR